jgi:hypothetical protein
MAEKKSFLLYIDNESILEPLSNNQLGELLRMLFKFAKTEEQQESDDATVALAFRFLSAQMQRDFEKYESVCEKRKESGKKGGAPKGNQNAKKQPKQANGCFDKQKQAKTTKNNLKQAKQPDTDIDTDTDIVSVSKDTDNMSQDSTAPYGAVPPAQNDEVIPWDEIDFELT